MVSATNEGIRRGKLLVPRLNSEILPRPRVTALLNGALDVPVTLITGPPGYGKTTALVGWLETLPCTSAWVTMDQGDANVARFVAHLVAAVQEAIPDFGANILPHMKSPNWVSESAGQALADELFDLQEDLVLVLDDFHEVPGHDIGRIIAEIVAFPSPRLHIAISSRWDPQVSLARLRGRGQLLEIRSDDLRFTYDETASFIQAVQNLDVGDSVISVLQERTEGWIAGLRLASIALRGDGDAANLSERLVSGRDRHVMSFLMDEMLARLPEEMQQFLVRTSFIDEISGPLAAAIVDLPPGADSADAMLQRLSEAYVYEEREANGHVWYHCHPLFRTLLRQRLTASASADELRELYTRASAWFAGEERIGDAIRYALDAGNVEQAVELVEGWRLRFLARERWEEVGRWLKMLPPDVVASRLVLQVTRYRLSAYKGTGSGFAAAGRELQTRIAEQSASMDETQRKALEAEFAIAELHTRYFGGDKREILATSQRLLADLPPEDMLGRAIAMFGVITALHSAGKTEEALALVQESLRSESDEGGVFSARVLLAEAVIHLQEADLIQADRVARYVLRLASDKDFGLVGNWARFVIGYIAYERNDLDVAEGMLSEVVATRERAHYICAREAMIGLALIGHARSDAPMMEENVEAVLEWALSHGVLSDLAVIEAFQARLRLLNGQSDAADRWLSTALPTAIGGQLWFEVPLLTRVKALLIDGRLDRIDTVLKHLDALEEWALSNNTRQRLVEIDVLRALARLARGDEEGAASAMARPLDIVGSGPFVRTWLDLGLDVEPLMRLVRDRRELPEHLERLVSTPNEGPEAQPRAPVTARAETRVSVMSYPDGNRGIHVYEMLTEREAEVLLLLAEHLTNQEIADRLYISHLTVKRHASNIYDKLGVGSRRQALIKATELGFLPGH